ncbi:tRNA modification GTPase MnmE [Tetrabaena socialis]|uniref:tRNA modification GTPase MnmE n=1 Tax=Tetrabaena socialis TaxID=47790 RepID=A0A2J7ZY15_9CHLO|nr:tRNA modification GTPase MnmE [Tetrabaena socialis]|eukprot:PNH05164.1 tRNA modification GTPase MnmE [Tetrabaena socialis]
MQQQLPPGGDEHHPKGRKRGLDDTRQLESAPSNADGVTIGVEERLSQQLAEAAGGPAADAMKDMPPPAARPIAPAAAAAALAHAPLVEPQLSPLDFDEDLPPIDLPALKANIEGVQAGIEHALRTARTGSLLRRGLQVAIVGRPNVGKSSLLNAWTNSDRAIVTEVAGTTRDVLEASLSVGGVPVALLDTAGIRQSEDVVERIGVERSQAAAAAADVVVMVVDGAEGWTDADAAIFRALWGDGPGTPGCKVKGAALLVANKEDLRPQPSGAAAGELSLPLLARDTFAAVVRTSAPERRGLEELDAALLRLAGAPEALMRLNESATSDLPLDFWTIDLRAALLALGEVSGEEVAEQVLDAVFSRFCIGK